MARRRFFVSEVRREAAELRGDEAEHLVRVLRVEPGQVFELSDNAQTYLAEVATARKSLVTFRVLEKLPRSTPVAAVTLCPALIKFDRFEWMLEKAVELGVDRVQPFAATRTEHGLLAASQKRVERWRKIGLETSQQSRRDRLPVIQAAVRSLDTLKIDADVKLLLDEERATPILQQLPASRFTSDRVAILVGPEGGWTLEERLFATQLGWRPCGLGNTILRAETAAVAALAVVRAAWSAPFVLSGAGNDGGVDGSRADRQEGE
jgi:16S rRNA (uracil1498-N3)-methyltransferase